jgi:hypothetical protein
VDAWCAIDWQRPWFAPYQAHGERVCAALGAGGGVAQALNAQGVADVPRFVQHDELPRGEAYEAFVARSGRVPTRDNLHDLFNGLTWLRWPRLKRRLNVLQAQQIAERGIGPTRGAVRDALTLADENGAWLQGPPELADALRERDWHALFVARRDAWRDARLVLFGHALLEKLVSPRKAITAHVWLAASDESVEDAMPPRRLWPLPVLGVPGWWPANESPGFYLDRTVFRVPGIMPA